MPELSPRIQLTYRPRDGPRRRLTFESDPAVEGQAYHYWLIEEVYQADVDDGRWRETGREHVDPPDLQLKPRGSTTNMELGSESPPDSRAVERAKEIAWDHIATAYHEGAAEAAEDALLEDPLWEWLAVAAARAADLLIYRTLDVGADGGNSDDVRGHIERAQAHLLSARDGRRDELLVAALDEYDPREVSL